MIRLPWLQVIRSRFGPVPHIIVMIFAFVTNIIVAGLVMADGTRVLTWLCQGMCFAWSFLLLCLVCLSVCLSVCLYLCLPVYLYILYVFLFVCLFICIFCLSFCLSVYSASGASIPCGE